MALKRPSPRFPVQQGAPSTIQVIPPTCAHMASPAEGRARGERIIAPGHRQCHGAKSVNICLAIIPNLTARALRRDSTESGRSSRSKHRPGSEPKEPWRPITRLMGRAPHHCFKVQCKPLKSIGSSAELIASTRIKSEFFCCLPQRFRCLAIPRDPRGQIVFRHWPIPLTISPVPCVSDSSDD